MTSTDVLKSLRAPNDSYKQICIHSLQYLLRKSNNLIIIGLHALLKFCEGSICTSTVPDLSGNGYQLTLKGGAVADNGELLLDGNAQYAEFPNNFLAGVNSYSVTCWVKVLEVRYWARIFDFGSDTGNYLILSSSREMTGKPEYAAAIDYVDQQHTESSEPLPLNKWAHIAATSDGTYGAIYQNGVLVGSGSSTVKPSYLPQPANYWIGRSQYTHDAYFKGNIQDFRVFSRAIRADEVQKLAKGKVLDHAVFNLSWCFPMSTRNHQNGRKILIF